MKFRKYHGLGNDFILVESSDLPQETHLPTLAVSLCDRHFAVGADGLLVCAPAEQPAHARMTIYNSDGSRPQMCGNGLRCFALYLTQRHREQHPNEPVPVWVVETDAGRLRCDMRSEADAHGAEFSVTMGPVSFGARVVAANDGNSPDEPLSIEHAGQTWTLWPASMGNPHAVIRVEDPAVDLRAQAETWGAFLSTHTTFGEGANIEWVRVTGPSSLDVVVFERGAGLTLACGTGACASAAVAYRRGWIQERAVALTLLGGPLHVVLPEDLQGDVILVGPAREAFRGHCVLGSERS